MIIFDEGEKIIKIVRKHYFVIMPTVLLTFFLAMAPFLLFSFLGSDFLSIEPEIKDVVFDFLAKWKVFGYSIWFLLLWVTFFMKWTNYYLDMWIITNKHIIDVDQKSFFHREITSFRYEQIQDITIETNGLVQTFLKFGTLHIQTAGQGNNIIIKDAHYPEEAKTLILQLQEQSKSKHNL